MYAEKAESAASKEALIFNCKQRMSSFIYQTLRIGFSNLLSRTGAHQNTLEWLPQMVASTLVVGAKYPCYAATLCGLWTVSRVVYTVGYGSGTPSKVLSYAVINR